MILSAYERRGKAKLFSDEEQIRAFYRSPLELYSTTRSVTPHSPVTIMQPKFEVDEKIIRFGLRGIRKGVRKILPRFIPLIGWARTGKDIDDLATD